MGMMRIKSDVDIIRCSASGWEPLPQAKAVVRSYCFCPAYFRERVCSKTQQEVVVYFSVFNFYITEFLFVERKISVSWYCLLLIKTCAVTVLKIPFHAELCRVAKQKHSPCSENVQFRCKTNGGREQSGLWRSRWTASLSAGVLAHPFTPSENLPQSMPPVFPLRPVLIALHLTA